MAIDTPGSQRTYPSDAAASGYESKTVSTTAVGLTVATIGDADVARITVETANIRFRTDGTDPTTTEGHILYIGDVLELRSQSDLLNFKAIRDDAVDATIRVTYS